MTRLQSLSNRLKLTNEELLSAACQGGIMAEVATAVFHERTHQHGNGCDVCDLPALELALASGLLAVTQTPIYTAQV